MILRIPRNGIKVGGILLLVQIDLSGEQNQRQQ